MHDTLKPVKALMALASATLITLAWQTGDDTYGWWGLVVFVVFCLISLVR